MKEKHQNRHLDLIQGMTYTSKSNFLKDEIISSLFPVGNMGGFRKQGKGNKLNYVVLFSTGAEPLWKDELLNNGKQFIYYGDKREPGDILKTKKGGNKFLFETFKRVKNNERKLIPPILVFEKISGKRDAIFKGMVTPSLRDDALTQVRTKTDNGVIDNYKALFDVLDISFISRKWINDLEQGVKVSENAPFEYIEWLNEGQLVRVKRSLDEFRELHTINTDNQGNENYIGELNLDDDFYEGSVKLVVVNKYERSTKARKECLQHYGYSCQVCGFNYEKVYGSIGRDYIHVHHLVPIHKVRENYIVNPHKDLVPVCANCHAMLHRKINGKEVEITQLRNVVNSNDKK